jgi:predicted Zn-dependent peptidase
MKRQIFVLVLLVTFSFTLSAGFDFSKIKNNISEFTLPNGLKFILLEDHSVPIASFMTYANVGGSDERIGIYGISHFLEHMAFKGTSAVGTKNLKAEKKLFAKMDTIFDKILVEKGGLNPDKEKIKTLEKELEKLKEEAAAYVVENELINLLERHGATGINAATGKDMTIYLYSLPSNKVELWAYLESSRFTDPVFREFYRERGVIQEERRVRTENTPIGKMLERLLSLAFTDHPYRISIVGPMSNIDNITRTDMIRYFKTNYTARNMVVGVTGDVTPEQLKKLAKKYFSTMSAGKKNHRILTVEPEQLGEKSITIYEDSQPILLLGYHIPSVLHEDFVKFSVLNNILTNGRSSRLRKKMVIDDKTAMVLFSFAGYPGNKYPTLYLVLAAPNSEHSIDELLKTIDEEIEKIKKDSVTEEELASAKTRLKVDIIRQLGANRGLLFSLMQAEMVLGSWQKIFDNLAAIEKVTTDDIHQLVNTYLIKTNRSIARIEKKEEVKK